MEWKECMTQLSATIKILDLRSRTGPPGQVRVIRYRVQISIKGSDVSVY